VRIPIGYWAFNPLPGDPYVQGQEAYLDRALGWIQDNGLKAWIDIHGAPGSQNGFDNSGLRDSLQWQQGDNVDWTLGVVGYVASKYGNGNWTNVVDGIELVNEPLGPSLNMNGIVQYYEDGYATLRHTGSVTNVVIHDAFMQIGYYNNLMQVPNYWNVVLDHHEYQVFSVGQLQLSGQGHVQAACQLGSSLSSENLWRVVGEWSGALTDCTPLLNGIYRGARYDGTYENSDPIGSCQGINDISTWSDQKKQETRQFIEAQMDAYEQGMGWIFWCYKTENTIEWDVRQLIANGLFPQPLSDRQYPNQCGY
jgi:glucan 1,3-beta-glucosidase